MKPEQMKESCGTSGICYGETDRWGCVEKNVAAELAAGYHALIAAGGNLGDLYSSSGQEVSSCSLATCTFVNIPRFPVCTISGAQKEKLFVARFVPEKSHVCGANVLLFPSNALSYPDNTFFNSDILIKIKHKLSTVEDGKTFSDFTCGRLLQSESKTRNREK